MSLIDVIDGYGKTKENTIAHRYRENEISYGELVRKSNAIAAYLIETFGEDKTPIVVYGHKQNEMLICFLACVKAGHAYVPIDSSLPIERVNDIIESSKTKMIFDVGELGKRFDNVTIKNKEQISTLINEFVDKPVDKSYRVKSEETYYIIYTSGSTGKPKGVQIPLSCLETFVRWGLSLCKMNNNKNYIFMNQAPFSFDLSVMDLYLSLASGSTLFSIDKTMIANLKELFTYFSKSDINIWVSTPSFAEMCLADSSFCEKLLPELELLLFCGETLSNTCVKKLHERFSKARVINLYGPTEATVAITAVEVTKEINENIQPLPVGYVKEDCKLLIMDTEGKEVEPGEKGEIIITGESVSIGYYNNKEMTDKMFSTVNIDGKIQRAYKTGDEGYIKDGLLYYCGRIDFQVKLNGFRIELEDIENNLRKIDFIKNAIVLPVVKDGKIQYLAAVIVLNRIIEEKEFKIGLMVKEELKKKLPDYMVPRKISVRESLPMTVNGKVNRKALMEEIK